ncbi:translesion DNA synthesis-associated protein ImuA [Ramlibacter monticola]|uniref:Translesion DNA synthesis-associated protein ImuA n=1 Tax=Ramlibacter monticola TaxID=1926872 RepID=A0A937CYB1_9BURK|nr:translesion DNA synthesis-associated protein ImuA [Ramlibacter monticola]MBL0394817.1 translesion DNA synthesis-associated protein ImuA [Ramlibacter monticola]
MTAAAPAPECPLPPQVWRGRELAQAQERTLATGHAALDAQLPGGGWPLGSLVEVLQEEQQQHVWQLLGPALAQAMQARGEPAVLVDAPYQPFGPSLRALGIVPERLLCVRADKPAARLWAAEQSLRCADVCAVLAWLPQARSEDLRRLHLCAQASEKLLVVFRPVPARNHASPARLRLLVQGAEELQVRILKRRGPPLLQPLALQAQPARLSALLAARKSRRQPEPVTVSRSGSHVLDRTATLAG